MIDFSINPDVVRISASAILGGIAFKIVERFLNSKSFVNEQTTLRAELRSELNSVRSEIAILRTEVDSWREKYFEQAELNSKLRSEIIALRRELQEYKERLIESVHISAEFPIDDDMEIDDT